MAEPPAGCDDVPMKQTSFASAPSIVHMNLEQRCQPAIFETSLRQNSIDDLLS